MTRPFPLAGLLRVRARAEEQAAAELAASRRAAERARSRSREAREALAGSTLPSGCDELAWTAAVAGRTMLAGLLAEAEVAAGRADEQVDARTSEWSAARRDLRVVDRLAERHETAERVREEHAEQVVLDEVASRRAAVPPSTLGEVRS
jgi:flagellar FliJ protein